MNTYQPDYLLDDATESESDPIPKPFLCTSCLKDGRREEEVFCLLNRIAQMGDDEFRCEAYELINENDGSAQNIY